MRRDVQIGVAAYLLWLLGLAMMSSPSCAISRDAFSFYLSLPILGPLLAIPILYGLAWFFRLIGR